MEFADRIVELTRSRNTIAVLGIDPQLDTPGGPGIPAGTSLHTFCAQIIEACAEFVVAIKPQLAFFEARGVDGMRVFADLIKLGRRLGLPVIADAKRGDIGPTSAAYAEAFLGDGEFGCDAVTINPYMGGDTIAPFAARTRNGRGVFILVRNSNPSAAEFQELTVGSSETVWEKVAERVAGWGSDLVGQYGFSSIGAVVGATNPNQARRARTLMPQTLILVPGYGAQGASGLDSVAAARRGDPAIVVNSSRGLMYAYQKDPGSKPADAARDAARAMRDDLNRALQSIP